MVESQLDYCRIKQKGHHRLARWSFLLSFISEILNSFAFFGMIDISFTWFGWLTGIFLFIGFYNLFSMRHLEHHVKILKKDMQKSKVEESISAGEGRN